MSLSTRAHSLSSVNLLNDTAKVDEEDDLFEQRRVLESIEILTNQQKHLGRRQLAQILHQQADSLKLKGDYESALILYHRAATIYPKDISHNIAARHTSAVIHSVVNPRGALRELMHERKNSISLMSTLCPEKAARQAQHILHNSEDPYEDVKKILQYIDSRGDISGNIHSKKRTMTQMKKSNIILGQLTNVPAMRLGEMKRSFIAGDWKTTLNIGNEFLIIIREYKDDQYFYRVAAHRYMALSHLSLKRHDRAISEVTRMIQFAKLSNDEKLISRSIAVLGKVHLTFGHLNAAAKAWERLSNIVNRPILKAWLFHEIGRCYFEMSNYSKALKMSRRCIQLSEVAHSIKWMCYGKLLNGQALIELERLVEALEALKFVAEKAEKSMNDMAMVNYVENLVVRVVKVLRKNSQNNINYSPNNSNISMSSTISNSNLERSKVKTSVVPLLKQLKPKQNDVNIYPSVGSQVLSLDNKQQKNNFNKKPTAQENSIVIKENPTTKSCHIMDKWKKSFCNGKHSLKSKFNLVDSTLNNTINTDLSTRMQILHPVGDTPQVDKWACDMMKLKKKYSIERHMDNDWKKMSQKSMTAMNKYQHEQNPKTFSLSSYSSPLSSSSLASSSAISTDRSYNVTHTHPHQRSLSNN
ncbi:hypothetical protein PV327_000559 [Microctonus hyperodae]|uniref:Outer dynein arm-docking complex subunit 4 n=1 Tax=Microctonus hyperodae TaxID=165561 RepID=A0AA39G6F8_MICHY|nr:hypothetical protein PV327_000559 [Microctonus hyperodae]